MNVNDIGTQLLYTTFPIWVEYANGKQGSGTASIIMLPAKDRPNEAIPWLVTNYHVVRDARRGLLELAERSGDAPVAGKRTRVEIDGPSLTKFVDPTRDLAALPIAGALTQLESSGHGVFFRSITPDLIPSAEVLQSLSAIEDVIFIGYPSGLYDEHNVTPLVRRGITATPVWNDFQGKPNFLIDAGVFPGSSGSPVFIFNQGGYASSQGLILGSRLIYLGVLTETIIRSSEGEPEVFLGLGKVIKSSEVMFFLNSLIAQLTPPN